MSLFVAFDAWMLRLGVGASMVADLGPNDARCPLPVVVAPCGACGAVWGSF